MLAPQPRMTSNWHDRPPRRVAVLRALQLGDMLCAVPALRALRAALPRAEIRLIGLPWARAFARRLDRYLDGFHALPGYPGLPEQPPRPDEVPAFLAAMQRERFDLVVQLHGSGTVSNPLALLLGGAQTAGFYARGQYCPDTTRFIPYPEELHEIHRLLRLPEALGIPAQGDELEFPLSPRDRAAAQALAEAHGLARGAYACVHPGSRSACRWSLERFAAVADALAAGGLHVVITGTADESALARELAGRIRHPAVDLTGRTDLGAAAALLEGARLLVCNNTGVSHLAAALRVPSVVLVENHAEAARWAPLDARRHRRVIGCATATPAAVLRECRDLLAADRPAAAPVPVLS